MTMRGSPDMANGSSNPHVANGAQRAPGKRNRKQANPSEAASYDNETEHNHPKTPHNSGRDAQSGQIGRSFSARARDQPEGDLNYTTRKPVPPSNSELSEESTTPRGLPTEPYLPNPGAAMPEIHVSSPPPAPGVSLPPTRSNTTRSVSASDSRRDWASDRSPLQKLEVTLSGISKEEKRARVQEAEMKARERIARKKAEQEKAELKAALAREASAQQAQPESQQRSDAARKNDRRDIPVEDGMRNGNATIPPQRQPGGTAVRQSRTNPTNPQFPAIRRPEDPQYARAETAIPSSAKLGNVPRRSVTVSGPAAKPGAPGKINHSRSMSQAGPRQIQASALRAETTDELLTAPREPQDSPESQVKPKKQSVSFNVPPPTPPPIFEWRNAQPARLGAADFDFQQLDMERSKAWWEGGGNKDRRKSRALPKNYKSPAQKSTGKIFPCSVFKKPIYLVMECKNKY
jgi:hypothetical protein